MRINCVDLFCGAGGFSLGLLKAGFDVLCGVDFWPVAAKTYSGNFSHPVLLADLTILHASDILAQLNIPEGNIDLVVGGPPCQGFSIQRIGADQDHRNSMILEFARLVTEFQPRMFLMENVPGLLGKRGKQIVQAFEEMMYKAGYHVQPVLVNAAQYGVPQIRKRVFYFGYKSETLPFDFPKGTLHEDQFVTAWDAIKDLPSPPGDYTHYPGDKLHRMTRLSPLNQQRIRLIPPGGGMEQLPIEMRVNCHKNGSKNIGHRYVYGRLAPDKPSSTITARFDSFTRGKFAHPFEHRNITLREGARLQTFPDAFGFVGSQEEIAAQIGNAVPPLLSEKIAKSIYQHLAQRPEMELCFSKI